MRWYRHGYKNACKLVPVPKFPSTPLPGTYRRRVLRRPSEPGRTYQARSRMILR
jgi:hypothetical protein